MNCSLCIKNTLLFLLLISSTALARWEVTDFNKQFTSLTARNGMLVGIEKKSNLPYQWEKPFWKKLSDNEFLSLATDGKTVIGIKQQDHRAYAFTGRSVTMIGSPIAISFEQLAFNHNQIFARGKNPYPFAYSWNNADNRWNSVGDVRFWSIDASGNILCGIQCSYEKKALDNLAFAWQNKKWQQLGNQQFKQLVTNGTTIIGLGKPPKSYAFEWTGKQWRQLGKERLTQLAYNQNILCGIQETIQLILVWNGQRWLAQDTKKFVHVVTDGKTLYGLANDNKVYYWTRS